VGARAVLWGFAREREGSGDGACGPAAGAEACNSGAGGIARRPFGQRAGRSRNRTSLDRRRTKGDVILAGTAHAMGTLLRGPPPALSAPARLRRKRAR